MPLLAPYDVRLNKRFKILILNVLFLGGDGGSPWSLLVPLLHDEVHGMLGNHSLCCPPTFYLPSAGFEKNKVFM